MSVATALARFHVRWLKVIVRPPVLTGAITHHACPSLSLGRVGSQLKTKNRRKAKTGVNVPQRRSNRCVGF